MSSKHMGREDAGGAASFSDNGFGGRGGNGTAAAATAKTKQQLGSVLTYLLVYPSTLSALTLWGVFLHTCWFTLAHLVPSHSGECSYILLVYPSTLSALTLWGVFLHTCWFTLAH